MADVSVYNTHPDFRSDFRRKKCVLYAEKYGRSLCIRTSDKKGRYQVEGVPIFPDVQIYRDVPLYPDGREKGRSQIVDVLIFPGRPGI